MMDAQPLWTGSKRRLWTGEIFLQFYHFPIFFFLQVFWDLSGAGDILLIFLSLRHSPYDFLLNRMTPLAGAAVADVMYVDPVYTEVYPADFPWVPPGGS